MKRSSLVWWFVLLSFGVAVGVVSSLASEFMSKKLLALVIPLAVCLCIQTLRLGSEESRHEATAEKLDKALEKIGAMRVALDLYQDGVSSLLTLARDLGNNAVAERERAKKRDAVVSNVVSVPRADAGVVDGETSRKAAEHVNESIRCRMGY